MREREKWRREGGEEEETKRGKGTAAGLVKICKWPHEYCGGGNEGE